MAKENNELAASVGGKARVSPAIAEKITRARYRPENEATTKEIRLAQPDNSFHQIPTSSSQLLLSAQYKNISVGTRAPVNEATAPSQSQLKERLAIKM